MAIPSDTWAALAVVVGMALIVEVHYRKCWRGGYGPHSMRRRHHASRIWSPTMPSEPAPKVAIVVHVNDHGYWALRFHLFDWLEAGHYSNKEAAASCAAEVAKAAKADGYDVEVRGG